MGKYKAQIIVTSDSRSENPNLDSSGDNLLSLLRASDLFSMVHKSIVSDDYNKIVDCIKATLVDHDPALIITVGGTGLCPRDVTPEATSSLYHKHCTGIVAALHVSSLGSTPFAALSRLTAGIIGRCLVINFPGSPMAGYECFKCIEKFIGHALDQVRSDLKAVGRTHDSIGNRHVISKEKPKVRQHKFIPRQKLFGAANDEQSKLTKPRPNKENVPQSQRRGDSLGNFNPAPNALAPKGKLSLSQVPPHSSHVPTGFKKSKSPANTEPRRLPGGISVSRNLANFQMRHEFEPCAEADKVPAESDNLATNAANLGPILGTESGAAPKASVEKARNLASAGLHSKQLQRDSPYPMIDFTEALEILKESCPVLGGPGLVTTVNLTKRNLAFGALNHVLADDVVPLVNIPPYDVSTMDGYVVNASSTVERIFEAKGQINANLVSSLEEFERSCSSDKACSAVYCYQINTGGRLPEGDNFVIVPTEKAELIDNQVVRVSELKRGSYIRPASSDLSQSDIIKRGTLIGPVELSLILAMGHKSCNVYRKPRIGILSTGDELVCPFDSKCDTRVKEDRVVDTNATLLAGLFSMYKYKTNQLGVAKDDPQEIVSKIELAGKDCDVILVTGGASMGSKDWVKLIVDKILDRGKILFGRVNMKPGKPVAYGSFICADKSVPIFSLPGNPVSAFVTSLVLVLPFLEYNHRFHAGAELSFDLSLIGDLIPVVIKQLHDEEAAYEFDGRLEFVRAKIVEPPGEHSNRYSVSVSLKQQSSRLLSLRNFDCLIMVDPIMKGKRFKIGDEFSACKLRRNL